MKESLHEIHEPAKFRKLLPYAVLAISLSLAVFVWLFWSNREMAKERLRYDELTNITTSHIIDRLHNYEMVLHGFSGLFAVSEDVTRNEWRAYYKYRQVQTFFPGVQGIGFSMVVQPSELARHIHGIRAEGFSDYMVRPKGKRDAYTAIIFLEPFDIRNQQAFGYDMFSEPVRRAAMERARDTGATSLSGKVTLVQEIDEKVQAGFLLYVPIYAKGVSLNTAQERRAALIGYVYSPFRVDDLMQGIFPNRIHGVEFEIYDGTTVSPASLMYDCDEHSIAPDEKHKAMFSSRQTLDLYGHQWTLSFESRPPYEAAIDHSTSRGILAAGIVISLLVFLFIQGQETTRSRAISLALEMTGSLQQSEEKFRVLSDSLPMGVSIIGPNMEILAVNSTKRKWFPQNDSGKDLPCYGTYNLPPRLEPCERCPVVMTFQDGQVHSFEREANTVQGKRFLFITAAPITDPDGKTISVHETVEDITERKRAEEQLLESEHRFRDIAHSMADWIWEVDENGKYTYVSDSVEKVLGYTAEEMLGRTPFEIMPEEEAAKIKERFLEIVSKSEPIVDLENRNLAKDGTEVCILTNGVPVFDDAGDMIGYRGVDKNITAQRKLEAENASIEDQLRQAQKMESVGRLAGGVAHDYNNALSAIIGFTELAMDEVDVAGSLRADLDEVLKAAKRATDITRQLLAFARKQTIAPKVIELNKNVESMLNMLRRLIGEDIDLAWLPETNPWLVKIDPTQLDQILANLCVNARDAIDGVGKVTIETKNTSFNAAYCADHAGIVPGEFVLLAVSDNGCGIEKEIQGSIFEPFFTTKDVYEGTGLGLATIYGIVKQNNGFINVYSEPGQGTTFKIYLARHKGKAVEIQEKSAAEIPQGRGETVLLVEDESLILNLAQRILGGLGYTVLAAGSPAEAIGLAEEHVGEINLLITDVIMPEMNGRDLAERLQSFSPDLRCIFMSGYTANVIAHHGVLDEGVRFIQKPFSRRDLAIMVRKVLDE